jgi:hypothetical protein
MARSPPVSPSVAHVGAILTAIMWKRGQRANGAAITSPGATTSIDGSPWKRGERGGKTAHWEREGDGTQRERGEGRFKLYV